MNIQVSNIPQIIDEQNGIFHFKDTILGTNLLQTKVFASTKTKFFKNDVKW